MRHKKLYFAIGGIFFLFLLVTIGLFSLPSTTIQLQSQPGLSTGINREVVVSVYHNGELIQPPFHNLFYDQGMNYTRDMLALGDVSAGFPVNITLCNATELAGAGCGIPQADAEEAFTPYIGCGLGSQQGTYTASADKGNWTLGYTFTSSCDGRLVNATRVQTNITGLNFSGFNFTLVTLQDSDTLTINITSAIS